MSEILTLIGMACRAAREHRFDEAAAQAISVLERLPTCLRALRVLAWAQLELDDDQALATFERCVGHDPEDALAYVGQAIWLQKHHQDDAARRQWTRAWELDPHNQAIRRALVKLTGELPESALAEGICLLRTGCNDAAADLLRRLYGERRDAAVALTLMTALWANAEQDEAFEVAGAVHASQPRSVKAALYVAALEDRAGRTLRCREAIARAEQVDPGLMLFVDVVREMGLQPILDPHSVSRLPLTIAR